MSEEKKVDGIYAKLLRAQELFRGVKEDGHNTHQNYRYATAKQIRGSAHDALAKAGVLFLCSSSFEEQADPACVSETTDKYGKAVKKQLSYSRVVLNIAFVDPDDGSIAHAEWFGACPIGDEKGIYVAQTMALKGFLTNSFLLAVGDEFDGDASGGKDEAPRPEQAETYAIRGHQRAAAQPVEQAHAQYMGYVNAVKAAGKKPMLKKGYDLMLAAGFSHAEMLEMDEDTARAKYLQKTAEEGSGKK